MSHDSFIPVMSHDSFIPVMSHDSFIPAMSHDSFIPVMSHDSFIPVMSHDSFIPAMSLVARLDMNYSCMWPNKSCMWPNKSCKWPNNLWIWYHYHSHVWNGLFGSLAFTCLEHSYVFSIPMSLAFICLYHSCVCRQPRCIVQTRRNLSHSFMFVLWFGNTCATTRSYVWRDPQVAKTL